MSSFLHRYTTSFVAAASTGLCASQSLASAGNLTLNGSLVSSGVGIMDAARRVGITSAGNDSSVVWTITGTDRNGNTLTENLNGGNAVLVQSVNDFLTVTSIYGSAATASTVTAGTTSVGSSAPVAIDYVSNPNFVSVGISFDSTGANATIEVTNDNPGPKGDFLGNTPVWFPATNLQSISTNTLQIVQGPITMMRTTINSGTGVVTTRTCQSFVAGNI